MPSIRTILALLLCFVIPLQGLAAVVEAAMPCGRTAEIVVAPMTTAVGHDCNDDVAARAKNGKVCKVGHECPCGGQCLFFPLALLHSFSPVAADHISPLDPIILAFTPATVWRPPIPL